ncbi:MAG: ROK family protein [Clostridia bacterium]|nr:ROK family protein [Clostridia bacterium]
MYRIGIDLGGTNIACGLVSDEMKIIEKVSIPTGAGRDPALIVDDMAAANRTLIEKAGVGIGEIAAVGIASPGIANHDDGVVEYANNLPFRRFPIASMLRERFPVDNIRVENDANAAAWGEAVAGAAKGTSSSVMITLGTGVGGGIIVDGKVQSGFNYAGGELGHIVICAGGRKCSCGRRGCWEAYSSATALIAMTEEKIADCEARGEKTVMKELAEKKGKVSARTAYDAMRLGDPAAIEVVDEYVFYLACGLTNIVNIFQPEVISIGGGISNEKDTLLKPLLPIIRKEQYGGGLVPETEIRIAELGNDAGIIGAAFLGL